jgi:hypothetical protein
MIKIKITVGKYTKTAIGSVCGLNLIWFSSYGIAHWYDQSTNTNIHDELHYVIAKWSFSIFITLFMFGGFLKMFEDVEKMYEQEK